MSSIRYVPEIDGLRAIAVISVLLFHAKFSFIPGGFVGVDVFFVISGYLITKIITTGISANTFNSGEFYKRRIARIVPALYALLILVAIIFFLIYPPAKAKVLLPELMSALLSAANIYFFFNIDYFSDAANSPILHAWSLAVEEQFYFVLPFILLLTVKRWRMSGAVVTAVLLLASLAASIHFTPIDQQGGFYLPWFRAWELLAGSLLSFLPATALPRSFKLAALPSGLALIFYALLTYSEHMTFPGMAAVVPVVGTMLCLASTGAGGPVAWLLSSPPFKFFGNISYSLYLAHWPLICIALLFHALGSNITKIVLVLASIALAWLSWRFVENPFRTKIAAASTKRVMWGFVIATVGMALLLWSIQWAGASIWSRSPKAVAAAEYLNASTGLFRTGQCFIHQRLPTNVTLDPVCLQSTAPGKPALLLIGDSHAANVYASLVKKYPGADILQATASGCLPLITTTGDPRCVRQREYVLREWLPQNAHRINAIVISGRWFEEDVPTIIRTIDFLAGYGKPVVFVGPHPEYYISLPLVLSYQYVFGVDLVPHFSKVDRSLLDVRIKKVFSDHWPTDRVQYFSVIDATCSAPNKCLTEVDGVPAMYDRDHFTQVGAERMMRGFTLPGIQPRP